MFGNWLKQAAVVQELSGAEQLEQTLRAELAQADDETVLVVTAIVGLLGVVAYADCNFSPAEQAQVRNELGKIAGISNAGIDAVCAALKRHILEITAVQTPRYCRVLRELADHELRIQVLGMLLALAAADDTVTITETTVMRQITTALGLTQVDYNAAQAKYRSHLAALKAKP
jgi:uncharacterized tellurite resistance protein B-like protein